MSTTWKSKARILTTAAAAALLTGPALAADDVTGGTEYSPKKPGIADSRTASDVQDAREGVDQDVQAGSGYAPTDAGVADSRTASDAMDKR